MDRRLVEEKGIQRSSSSAPPIGAALPCDPPRRRRHGEGSQAQTRVSRPRADASRHAAGSAPRPGGREAGARATRHVAQRGPAPGACAGLDGGLRRPARHGIRAARHAATRRTGTRHTGIRLLPWAPRPLFAQADHHRNSINGQNKDLTS